MINFKFFTLITLIVLLNSCAKEPEKIKNIKKKNQEMELVTTYNEAHTSLKKNDPCERGTLHVKRSECSQLRRPQPRCCRCA